MWMTLLLACTGEEPTLTKLQPEAAVFPEIVDFGEVIATYESTLQAQITNTGQADLNITGITVVPADPADDGVYTLGEWTSVVGSGDTVGLPITFTPRTYKDYSATLVIESDAEENPTLSAAITGTGVQAPTPDICLTPDILDFGMIGITSSVSFFEICNDGDGTLHITGMDQLGSGAFVLMGGTPSTIAPGESATVVVSYAPTAATGDNGTLTIHSDDPDEPDAEVLMLGNGGGDYDYPVAIINGPSSTEPRQTVNLDAFQSYDPDGDPIAAYEWSLVPPEGSDKELISESGGTEAYINTDIAGTYRVQLRVQSLEGVWSAPDTLDIEAIPTELLHVEMFWSTGGADMDLHVAQDGGDFFSVPDDCSYCNDVPDWGAAGDATDNPTLDIDDRYGYGPENINVDAPAVNDYLIRSHYFIDNGDGDSVVTVKVYLYGVEEATFSKVMSYNKVWDVASVHWSGDPGTTYVTEITDPVYSPSHRNCWE